MTSPWALDILDVDFLHCIYISLCTKLVIYDEKNHQAGHIVCIQGEMLLTDISDI